MRIPDVRQALTRELRQALPATFVLGVLLLLEPGGNVQADSEIPFVLTGAQSGTVTAVHQSSFDINGMSFHLAPDAVIVDAKGKPLEVHAIRVSADVKYLVKKEQANRIVKMVLYLPQ